ncbi:Hypothetical protein PHPALM_12981 [Phytophthora palmivora]|uniref:Retrotransposon gag domain-containing protein n=1 Tax=Phytophthora palmivora TaxID=4796 RepID=A0A2P4XYD0_9STRA|nr:Hypothetical protein PHPALM_12981 [Phytophthora palmivora]
MIKNPVMQIIKPKIISDLKGPVQKPTARSSKLEAAKALLHLIKESGIITGSFDANDLFDTRLSAINTALILTAKITTRSTDDMLRSLPAITLENQTGTSSHYESATEEVDTDSADDPPRMTLGPSDHETKRVTDVITPNITQGSNAKLGSYFQAAMNRFLKEQQGPSNPVILAPAEDRDVGIRVSAMSELKGFAAKEGDEYRTRAWLSKKCLVFGDLLTGSARNLYRQLSRTTRSTWKDLLRNFQVQYCGRGVSVARQYYHARKRSDESPLQYLYRLNVAGLRARLQIKDGPSEVRREHVEHFIETLDDRDPADHLVLLRIPDADTLEEALRSRQRAKPRQSKAVYGSIKPRQKNNNAAASSASTPAIAASLKKTLVDRMAKQDYVVSTSRRLEIMKDNKIDRIHIHHLSDARHCGSRKQSDIGCWRRLTCEKCGRKRTCLRSLPIDMQGMRGKVYHGGILQFDPAMVQSHQARWNAARDGGEDVKLGRSPVWKPVRDERSSYCIYAYVEKQTEATVHQLIDPIDNTCGLLEKSTATVSSLRQIDDIQDRV